jgi:signal transduction histidine kinase
VFNLPTYGLGILVKYTEKGSITVRCSTFGEPEGLRDRQHTAVEIVVADTGCGIQSDKLEHIFREFEHVESSENKSTGGAGVGKTL